MASPRRSGRRKVIECSHLEAANREYAIGMAGVTRCRGRQVSRRFAQSNDAVVTICTLPGWNGVVAEGDGEFEAGYIAMTRPAVRRGCYMGEGGVSFLFWRHTCDECLPGMAIGTRSPGCGRQ